MQQAGHCDGAATTFDGRRLSRIEVRTAGQEILPRSRRSIYSGPALRCDFTGQMLAGFLRDTDRRSAARPRRGSAWLGQAIPGGPLVPVRMSFATDWFGDAVMYLTAINSLYASRG